MIYVEIAGRATGKVSLLLILYVFSGIDREIGEPSPNNRTNPRMTTHLPSYSTIHPQLSLMIMAQPSYHIFSEVDKISHH
jgi:hypothetical protein